MLLAFRPTATRRSMSKQKTRRQPSLEQRAVEHLRVLAKPHRLRVRLDVEGFPVTPGRYGQIEWFGGVDLAVYTDRPRLFARICAIPGVGRDQTGDTEMRAFFPPQELASVAAVIAPGAGGRRPPREASATFDPRRLPDLPTPLRGASRVTTAPPGEAGRSE
jgi:hypothetical protein